MTDSELLGAIDQGLAEYEGANWNVFVRPDRQGALHYIGDDDLLISPTNTAILCRFTEKFPSYGREISAGDRERWKQETLQPQLASHVVKLTAADPDKPERSEYDAYRMARILLADGSDAAEEALVAWVNAYTRKWLLGSSRFDANLFIIYLTLQVVGARSGFPTRNVQRLADFAVARHVAFGMAELRSELDAVDLALAMAMSGVESATSRLFATGLDILNQQATHGRTWRNQQLLLRVGDSVVGCSAFEAVLSLLDGGSGPRVSSSLRSALISHSEWLWSQRPTSPPWRVSDLSAHSAVTEPWFNCLVVEFLLALRRRVAETSRSTLLSTYQAGIVKGSLTWDDMVLEPDYSAAIKRAFIEPIRRGVPERLEQCTALLFGPPGTSKTTIAETIARELGWPFLELGVAHFLAKGLEGVFSCATEVFNDLLQLQRAVVLLDEVEEVFAERTGEARDLRQKFLTSALLPPLRQVKKRGQILLIIATNHIMAFDVAARRPGRIDLIIPVGPPMAGHRRKLLIDPPVSLPAAIADVLEPLLPKYATIEEILGVGRFPRPAGSPADVALALHQAWTRRYGGGQIDEPTMIAFREERGRYARLD